MDVENARAAPSNEDTATTGRTADKENTMAKCLPLALGHRPHR